MMRLAAAIALFFGIGKLKPGPGTWGSAAATLLAWPILAAGGPPLLAALMLLAFLAGTWACDVYERATGGHDAGEVVIDEVVGQWLTLLLLALILGRSPDWTGLLLGFAAFRLFDIAKPWPLSAVDRAVPGGFGTMIDDVLAALPAGLLLWLLSLFTGVL